MFLFCMNFLLMLDMNPKKNVDQQVERGKLDTGSFSRQNKVKGIDDQTKSFAILSESVLI